MKKLTIIGFVSVLLLGLAGVWPAAAAKGSEGVQQGPVMKAHVINVGQANSTLLEFPCGAILIDAGAQDNQKVETLVTFLNEFFARRTDLDRTLKSVIITHNHIDHTRALQAVVKNFKVERYIDHGMLEGPGTANPNWVRDEVEEGRRQIRIKEIKDSAVAKAADKKGLRDDDIDPVRCDNCDPDIHVLSGRITQRPDGWSEDEFDNKNNHSIATRVDFGESSFLFTGDLEESAIERLVNRYRLTSTLNVDVYHVGHHGSHNGTTPELLQAIMPKIAVISCGKWNFGKPAKKNDKPKQLTTFTFGHPRRAVIDLLTFAITEAREHVTRQIVFDAVMKKAPYAVFRQATIRKRIYATAWDGNIEIQADLQGGFSVATSNN